MTEKGVGQRGTEIGPRRGPECGHRDRHGRNRTKTEGREAEVYGNGGQIRGKGRSSTY